MSNTYGAHGQHVWCGRSAHMVRMPNTSPYD